VGVKVPLSKENDSLHPAELARRKREEEKQKAVYEKIANLKRRHISKADETPVAEVVFALDVQKSRLACSAVLQMVEVDSAGKYLRDWQATSLYELSPLEKTLLGLLHNDTGSNTHSPFTLAKSQCEIVLPTMHRSQKLYRLDADRKLSRVNWNGDSAELIYTLDRKATRHVDFSIQLKDKLIAYSEAMLAVPGLLLLASGVGTFLQVGDESITRQCLQAFLTDTPFPDELLRLLIEESCLRQQNEETTSLSPRLIIRTARYKFRGQEQLHADLFFSYAGIVIHEQDEREQLYEKKSMTSLTRDRQAESHCQRLLSELSFRWSEGAREEKGWKLLPSRLDNAVRRLVSEGWIVNASGKCYRAPVDFEVTIHSSLDWFELKADVSFGEESVPMPVILKMWREGKEFIELGDGSFGLLPIEWLTTYTVLTQLGRDVDGKLICSKSQAAILQVLLDGKAQVSGDQAYEDKLSELAEISKIAPTEAPSGFIGQLRHYQEESLGWMLFLQGMGLGGILALDMGLGKTPTVLALLQTRKKISMPSLVIVPRSLIFNWEAEARKFTPDLSILIWRGTNRHQNFKKLTDYDIVLSTYGTLCRDAELLQPINFDYCILDESQAIKNSDTSNAKAVRSVNCNYRIAMTGTPIENSLSELWSQFEFLNPGLLGRAGAFKKISAKKEITVQEELQAIGRSLQPFLFRRTKEAVAKDLPGKSEVILYCEMEGEQKKIYDELMEYYRQEMESQAEEGRESTYMLAALLRLRQAACHPGLINKNHENVASAKLEMLLHHLAEIIEAGHKVLVFSQFTSMLSIVRSKLDAQGVSYCYLDGQTNDRSGVVNDFQENAGRKVFLISLKAGGVGLNLTAASYVFLLDPWWNPAIEAQAVDRAYRIGQKNNVIAYRMVTKGTVEEKIVLMQAEKRQLALSVTEQSENRISTERMKDLLN
jgi:superfamily II DNA or RNA helicase